MLKQISILVLIFIFNLCAFAQTEKYNAPIKWERYKVSEREVSVLFPKLPILIQRTNICSEEETNQYAAYAGETVYGLTIVSKTNQKVPNYCNPKEKFDEEDFDNKLKEIKTKFAAFDETKFAQNDFEVIKLDSKTTAQVYWLINDFKNKRWFEFWITSADKDKTEIKNFVESIDINKNAQGVEIGKGSNRTLGDESADDAKVNSSSEKTITELKEEEVQDVKIVLKAAPRYTDAARQAQIQGTVRVRITFSASGGIGTVSPQSTLPFGLTEQAMAAAYRIVFIPAKRGGKNISKIKTVDYSFSLY